MAALHVKVPVQILREGDAFVAHTPAFDLATHGASLEEAKKRFGEAAEIFLEECVRRGTLREALLDLGWREKPQAQGWIPPTFIEHTMQDVAIPVA